MSNLEDINKEIWVTKYSGEKEIFDVEKLKRSLRNAKAPEEIIEEIADNIEASLYEGVSTREIYIQAYKLLKQKNQRGALRYKLKKALLDFGPTGFPFEHFVGELFSRQGYKTQVGQVLEGNCINHEMDVIATKGNKQYLIECKFARDQKNRLGVQIPLYVNSRVDDIIRKRKHYPEYHNFSFYGWVVTNAQLSNDSVEYSRCIGLKIMGWNYPRNEGLKDIIEKVSIFPITIVNQLTVKEKNQLIDKGIVTCSQLLSDTNALNQLKLTQPKRNKLLEELRDLCG